MDRGRLPAGFGLGQPHGIFGVGVAAAILTVGAQGSRWNAHRSPQMWYPTRPSTPCVIEHCDGGERADGEAFGVQRKAHVSDSKRQDSEVKSMTDLSFRLGVGGSGLLVAVRTPSEIIIPGASRSCLNMKRGGRRTRSRTIVQFASSSESCAASVSNISQPVRPSPSDRW